MTLPIERTRAVIELGNAVMALAPYMSGKSDAARVPRELLFHLHAWLRHYPTKSELALSAKSSPDLWFDMVSLDAASPNE